VPRRRILFPLLAAMISALAGCGGPSTFNVLNPPPPPPSTLAIAFQPSPVGALLINAATTLTAVVSNDSSNAGVEWSLTCQNPSGNCGSISPLHTASGSPTTYTPPSTLSGNSQTVNIVASASVNQAVNVDAPITITAFGSDLKGSYVLEAQGADVNGGPNYQFAGVIVLDGNGGVSSGEQTINFFDLNLNGGSFVSKSDAITGGSYFLGADGRGTITIKTNDNDIGGNGVETFSLVFLSAAQALIAQMDFASAATGVTASGTMNLQASTIPAPTGGYAFAVSGSDFASGSPTGIGGILNIDSPNNISGKGSITDQNLAGIATTNQKLSGTLSNPDSFGAVTLNLTVPGFTSTTAFQFTGYLVDQTHIDLIESDNNPSAGGIGSTAGIAIGQGSSTGTLTSFSGSYVFGILGQDLSSSFPATLTSAGVFTAVDNGNGTGNLTNAFTDTFLQAADAQISGVFSGTYSDAAKGIGRVRSFFDNVLPHPAGGFHANFIFYQTGNGNPALVLASANNDQASPLFLATGIVYPQSGPLTFGGDYGLNFTEQNGNESDGTGQMTANPASTPPSLSGAVDINSNFAAAFDNPLSGTFNSPSSNGLFPGVLTGQAFDFSPFAADFYIIDPGHGFFVETDLVNPNDPSGVVTLGYYAARTPVCASCQ